MPKSNDSSNLPPLPDFMPPEADEPQFPKNPKRSDVPPVAENVASPEPVKSAEPVRQTTTEMAKNVANDTELEKEIVEKKEEPKTQKPEQEKQPQPKKKTSPLPTAAPTRRSSRGILWGFAAVGLLLALTFYAMLFWGLLSGTASNPLFETLGIKANELKGILINFTNFLFGFIALVLLLMTLVYTFRWVMSPKAAVNKKQLAISSGVYFVGLLVTAGLWIFLYLIIVQSTGATKSDTDNSLIQTNPPVVTGLSSPILVEFDIGERLYQTIDPSLVKIINWDFDGDGQTDASGPKVTHKFLDRGELEGRFPVTAEVFYFSTANNEELSFKSVREVIIENESVIASFTASPEAGPFPLDVELNAAESRDPDGEIILYEWDLDGDGQYEISSQEDATVFETFNKVGEYKVSLRVTGRNNDFNVTERTITVRTPDSDLKAVITSTDPLEGPPPLKINLDGSQSFVKEGKIIKYEWFIEGESESVPNRKIERIFREPGEYTVTLTVQNDLGEQQQTEKIIRVFEREVDPEIVIRTQPELGFKETTLQGVAPFVVKFDASQSVLRNPIDWEWDFESDGIVDAYSSAVEHTFREPGGYEVALNVTDSDGVIHEGKIDVVVSRSGTVARIVADPVAGPVPLEVSFDGSASSTDNGQIVSYKWQFPGQPLQQKSAQVTYRFDQIGDFPVVMEILTSKGERSTDTFVVSVRTPDTEAKFDATPPVGSAPMTVTFTPEPSAGIIREYLWDFGDGRTQKSFRAIAQTHRYTQPGEYEVSLKVIDQNNLVSTSRQTIIVK